MVPIPGIVFYSAAGNGNRIQKKKNVQGLDIAPHPHKTRSPTEKLGFLRAFKDNPRNGNLYDRNLIFIPCLEVEK